MTQFHTLRVSCRPTGVADYVNVVRLGHSARATAISLSNCDDFLEQSQGRTSRLSFRPQCFIDTLLANDDQILDLGGLPAFLHVKHLLCVVRRAEDRGHFRLIQDEFDLGCTHGIVEPHSRHIVMHAGEQCLCPFRTILRPNTYEAP